MRQMNMERMKENSYEAPAVEILKVKVERGYDNSNAGGQLPTWKTEDGEWG